MAWFTEERLASLKIAKNELSKSVITLFERLNDVKDKDSMVEFATSIKNLKSLKPVDKLFIAAFDPRLSGEKVDKYIEELKNFRYIPTTPRAALPIIYLRTYGETEIESRKDENGKIPMTKDDIEHLEKEFNAESNESEIESDEDKTTKSDDESQNNGNKTTTKSDDESQNSGNKTGDSTASA